MVIWKLLLLAARAGRARVPRKPATAASMPREASPHGCRKSKLFPWAAPLQPTPCPKNREACGHRDQRAAKAPAATSGIMQVVGDISTSATQPLRQRQ